MADQEPPVQVPNPQRPVKRKDGQHRTLSFCRIMYVRRDEVDTMLLRLQMAQCTIESVASAPDSIEPAQDPSKKPGEWVDQEKRNERIEINSLMAITYRQPFGAYINPETGDMFWQPLTVVPDCTTHSKYSRRVPELTDDYPPMNHLLDWNALPKNKELVFQNEKGHVVVGFCFEDKEEPGEVAVGVPDMNWQMQVLREAAYWGVAGQMPSLRLNPYKPS